MQIDAGKAKDLFLAVLDMPQPERTAYLDAACADNAPLRQRVEAMLATHANSGELLPRTPGEMLADANVTDADMTAAFTPPDPGSATQIEEVNDADLSFLAPSEKPEHLGRLGHYEILSIIGRGGFGVVLKAFDTRLHRVVAIKVLSPAYAANGSARKRFIREARTAAAVKNDHIVGIYDVQDDAQPPYLAMEMIDGISLQDKLDKQGPLGLKEILRIGMQTAEGLAAAHKQGLVHRDIKPANILLENGVERVKITDFGLARAVDDASVTQSGTVAGTPMYMSPEQAEGLPIDHRSDLFSLGTVLYAMCTGHPPFRASGTHAVLKRVIDASPRPIREVNNEIPEWLADIISKLHAKKPEDRYQTAKEVAELLGQRLADVQAGRAIALAGRASDGEPAAPSLARPANNASTPPSPAHAGRRRVAIVGSLLAVAAITVGLALASPFLYRYFNNQGTLIFSGTMDPNLDKILVKQKGETIAELTTTDAMVHVPAGDYQIEVVCKQGYELEKYRVGGTFSGATDWQVAKGQSFPVRLARADHVSINVELAKLPSEPGWTPLFNNNDIDGWQTHPDHPGKWEVKDGILIASGPWSHLFKKIDFDRFHLRAKVQVNDGGEGAICFRVPDIALPWNKVPAGYMVQINSNTKLPMWTGALYHLSEPKGLQKTSLAPPKPGEWFDLEILSDGGVTETRVNGKQAVFEVETIKRPFGRFIALACMGPNTVLQFKKVEIKELPGTPVQQPGWVQLFNRKDLTGWLPSPIENWKIEDGVIVGKGKCYLVSKESFRSFHCRIEAKTNHNGHAGVGIRQTETSGAIADVGKTVGSLSWFTRPQTQTIVDQPEKFVPPDTWFVLEVIAVGKQVVVKVNGKITADANLEDLVEVGKISINAWNADTVLHIRKIEVKELPPEEPGWVQLFNGKDLTGWKRTANNWTVEKGILVGKDVGDLLMVRSFTDFHCRMRAKVNADCWASLQFRGDGEKTAQVVMGHKHPGKYTGTLLFQSNRKIDWLAPVEKELVPPDTWFDLEAIVRGKQVTAKVNGLVTADMPLNNMLDSAGIGLFINTPGSVIHVEKIEIKELPASSAAPFVILAKDKRAELQHATLADAVKAAQSGDTIEIRGDGPFETVPIDLGKKALAIRAGEGFRPHLKCQLTDPESKESLLQSQGPLVLEGLTLEVTGHADDKRFGAPTAAVNVKFAAARIANCRLLSRRVGAAIDLTHVPDALITNCTLIGPDDPTAGHGIRLDARPGSSRVAIENNLIYDHVAAVGLNVGNAEVEKMAIALRRNSVHTFHTLTIWSWYTEKSPELKLRFPITMTENVVFAQIPVLYNPHQTTGALEKSVTLMPKLFSLQADNNLFEVGMKKFIRVGRTGATDVDMFESLMEWNDLWGIKKTQSRTMTTVFDKRLRGAPDPFVFTPADFRLPPGHPGKGAGPGGKDVGADVDLVGPGAAYEKWQKTKEYEEWRKQTEVLMANAAAPPFVILAKDKRAETQHGTLADAVKAAQSGDAIEIRGDGPFVTDSLRLDEKLTIRAAPGYQPVLRLSAESMAKDEPLVHTTSNLVLEGLHLQMQSLRTWDEKNPSHLFLVFLNGGSLHMANCKLDMSRLDATLHGIYCIGAENSSLVDLRNCLQLEGGTFLAITNSPEKARYAVENCLLKGGHAVMARLQDAPGSQIQLRNNTFAGWSPCHLHLFPNKDIGSWTLETGSNIFATQTPFSVTQLIDADAKPLSAAEFEKLVRRTVSMNEKTNVYSMPVGKEFLHWGVHNTPTSGTKSRKSLASWEEFWDLKDTGSIQAKVRFKNDRVHLLKVGLTADDFRLAPGSPGQGVLPGRKDVGADIDHIGPGAGYDKWRQSKEYEAWRKQTESLMACIAAPFVIPASDQTLTKRED